MPRTRGSIFAALQKLQALRLVPADFDSRCSCRLENLLHSRYFFVHLLGVPSLSHKRIAAASRS